VSYSWQYARAFVGGTGVHWDAYLSRHELDSEQPWEFVESGTFGVALNMRVVTADRLRVVADDVHSDSGRDAGIFE
jgi:hypothetical protein